MSHPVPVTTVAPQQTRSRPRGRVGHRLARALLVGGLVAGSPLVLASTPASAATCAQPSLVWIATHDGSLAYGGSVTVAPTDSVWVTGIEEPTNTITFDFVTVGNPPTTVPYTTGQANGNCVVNQEQVAVSSFGSPGATIAVYAWYTPWETVQFTETFVGYIHIEG